MIKHIDGLSGEEEQGALIILNKGYKEYMVRQKLCPECESELIEVHQADGPDDFECTGLTCTNCDYEFGY